MSPIHFTLYGRETCHLCHDLLADVRVWARQNRLSLQIEWVDIDESVALTAQYGLSIPVLCNALGQVVLTGRMDAEALRKLCATK